MREASRAGADVIKFTATGGVLSQQGRGLEAHFTDEEMRAIVTTAHSLGLRVAAHAHGARGIEAAARAGVDSIEHGTFADAAAIQAMRQSNTFLVPTLMAFTGVTEGLAQNRFTPIVAAKAREALAASRPGGSHGPRCGRTGRVRHRRGRLRAWPQRRRVRAAGRAWRDEPGRGRRFRDDGCSAAARAGE